MQLEEHSAVIESWAFSVIDSSNEFFFKRDRSRQAVHIWKPQCSSNRLLSRVIRLFPTTYMTPEGKALKEQYWWEAKAQWKGKPLEGDVALSFAL
jgi:hypothetical protein